MIITLGQPQYYLKVIENGKALNWKREGGQKIAEIS
jgi:hypothetical protein